MTTVFGQYHVVGTKFFEDDLQKFDNAFSQYTQYFLYCVVGLKALQTLRTKEKRDAFIELVKQAVTGEVKCPKGNVLPKVGPDPEKLKHDSEHFIAPANIFRVCAVLHPGKIGWIKYQEFAMSGAVTVYMQVFLPCKILSDQLAQWEMVGFKSPLWFGTHMGMFVTSFAALASLVKVFKGKCAQIITESAQANSYLLSMDEPKKDPPAAAAVGSFLSNSLSSLIPVEVSSLKEKLLQQTKVAPEGSTGESTKDVAVAAAEEGKSPVAAAEEGKSPGEPIASTGEEAKEEEEPEEEALGAPSKQCWIHPRVIWLNKLGWCIAGLFSDILMSTLLLFSMVLKVATFTGQIQDIALVMVSLYFVFNLQYQILDTDPNIKLMYMKAVKELTEETQHSLSKLIMHVKERVAAIMLIAVSFIGPIGLAIIVLAAWHDKKSPTGCIIGVDPFKGMADCGGI